ncbi:hypothetical protein CAPTEDRAFT_198562, partial [Capitella teleta]
MAVVALRVVIITGLLISCEGQRSSQRVRHGGFRDVVLFTITFSFRNGNYFQARNECFCGNNYDYDRHGERQNDCSSPCQNNNNETCGGDWRIQIYSVCPTGKYRGAGSVLIDNKPNCENECHCRALPCLYLNGTCTDGCAIGWKGDACNERDCGVDNGGCHHHCSENRRDEWCSCREGFQVSPDDWTRCIEITTKIATHALILLEATPASCRGGYELDPSTKQKCIDINECEGRRGSDYYRDCHTCVNEIGSYTCTCDEYYELDKRTNKTCVDVNECNGERGVDFNEDCHRCHNTAPGYRCRCDRGYEEDNSKPEGNCVDVNECNGERGVDFNEDCHRCHNTAPGYRCRCDPGYEEDNSKPEGNCVDVNECLGRKGYKYNNDCHNCINTKGSYTCSCRAGYEPSSDGKSCNDIDECHGVRGINYTQDCHTCINQKGGYTCDCDEGYELQADGKSCIDTDECERGQYDVDNCHTCVNFIGGYTCFCNDSYVLDTSNNKTCIVTGQRNDPQLSAMSGGAIAGSVICILALAGSAMFAIFFHLKRRKDKLISSRDHLNEFPESSSLRDEENRGVQNMRARLASPLRTIKAKSTKRAAPPEQKPSVQPRPMPEELYVNTANAHFIAMSELK